MVFATFETFVIADWCRRQFIGAPPSIELQYDYRLLTAEAKGESAMVMEERVTAMLEAAVREGVFREFDRRRSELVTALVNKCLRRVNWAQVTEVITRSQVQYHALTIVKQWQ